MVSLRSSSVSSWSWNIWRSVSSIPSRLILSLDSTKLRSSVLSIGLGFVCLHLVCVGLLLGLYGLGFKSGV